MTDNINKISQTKHQQTSASLANLTDEDIIKIWDAVSAYIESYMKQAKVGATIENKTKIYQKILSIKGVNIPGFGTFSFIQKRIDVGNNKYLLIQRPVFVLSEKIAQNHGLKYTHYPINGSIPLHSLNYFYIQTQTAYTRDQIDQCVKHVLQILNRSIASQRNVEFTFSHIGKLQIRNGKVKMRFFKDFVSSVDENAAKHIIDNMCNVSHKKRTNTYNNLHSNFDFVLQSETANMRFGYVRTRGYSTADIIECCSSTIEQSNW